MLPFDILRIVFQFCSTAEMIQLSEIDDLQPLIEKHYNLQSYKKRFVIYSPKTFSRTILYTIYPYPQNIFIHISFNWNTPIDYLTRRKQMSQLLKWLNSVRSKIILTLNQDYFDSYKHFDQFLQRITVEQIYIIGGGGWLIQNYKTRVLAGKVCYARKKSELFSRPVKRE